MLHVNWLKNCTSTCALDNMTPYEALTGHKPNLSNLHEWGTKVWVHDATNSKLEGWSNIGRWVGYDKESTHAHRIYWPGRRTISVERNIKFHENNVLIPAVEDMPLEGEMEPTHVNQPVDNNNDNAKQEASSVTTSQPPSHEPSPIPERPKHTIKPSAYVNQLLNREGFTQGTYKNGRAVGNAIPAGLQTGDDVGALGEYWEDLEIGGVEFAMGAAALEAEGMDPGSLAEAKGRSDWPMWKEARQKELESLRKAGTWTVVEHPSGKNIVGSKWVFHIKKDANGPITSTKHDLLLMDSLKYMVLTTRKHSLQSPNSPAFAPSLPSLLAMTGPLKSLISIAHSSMENSMKKFTCNYHPTLRVVTLAALSLASTRLSMDSSRVEELGTRLYAIPLKSSASNALNMTTAFSIQEPAPAPSSSPSMLTTAPSLALLKPYSTNTRLASTNVIP